VILLKISRSDETGAVGLGSVGLGVPVLVCVEPAGAAGASGAILGGGSSSTSGSSAKDAFT
jgi:hypothetical protein